MRPWIQGEVMRLRGKAAECCGSVSGAAAVEFAVVVPVFILMLVGIIQYGGYFWLSHSAQQLANDAARAAIAGLSAAERTQLAQAAVTNELPTYSAFTPNLLSVAESEQSQAFTVSLSYNAAQSGFWMMPIIPMPSTTIVRSATVKLGGY